MPGDDDWGSEHRGKAKDAFEKAQQPKQEKAETEYGERKPRQNRPPVHLVPGGKMKKGRVAIDKRVHENKESEAAKERERKKLAGKFNNMLKSKDNKKTKDRE